MRYKGKLTAHITIDYDIDADDKNILQQDNIIENLKNNIVFKEIKKVLQDEIGYVGKVKITPISTEWKIGDDTILWKRHYGSRNADM